MNLPANDLQSALERFGLTAFRPGQQEVISQIVAGHDCLCVMPTGGGKSLCFQLPTLVRSGLTIVVSPLIALMKDQVDALQKRGIAATLINSSLTTSEQNARLQWMAEGKFSLVYVAPERLRNSRFLEVIRSTPIQLLAIDEAHCISEWGHDFRPDYARIGQFRELLGGVQTVALTATATARVRQDIVQILHLRNPKHFITGFARTNLHFSVLNCRTESDKEQQLLDFLQSNAGSGIIYAATRKKCEELVALLTKSMKMSVGAYHAGLTIDQRRFIQEQFMKGELRAIVATNAFGMGIDKSDLRFVVHYNMPGSLEAYYQEAGRAGRDGKYSQCLLLYSFQDRFIQEFFIDNRYPPAAMIRDIYDYLYERPEDPIELTQQEIRELLDLPLSAEAVGTALQVLSRTGVLERLESGAGLGMVRISSDLPTLVDLLPRTSTKRRKVMRTLEKAVGDRRHEAVYVHPRWLMQHTELERDSLNEALREINKLEQVEYVPPFRGRAVHFRKRGLRFDDLQIDFKALEELKRAEYEKLEQVIAFAEGKRCRQLGILQYFGDPSAAPCGLCDRCQNRVGWLHLVDDSPTSEKSNPAITAGNEKGIVEPPSKLALDPSLSTPIAKVICQVLAIVERSNGKLGKLLLAQFLVGSENAKVQRLRLDRLANFACLRPLKQTEANLLLENMLTAGMLEQKALNKNRPTVWLSQFGRDLLQGKPLPSGMPFPIGLQRKLAALNLTAEPARSLALPKPTPPTPSASAVAPKSEALRADSPQPESFRAESPKPELLRAESTRTSSPRIEPPRSELPRVDPPHLEQPSIDETLEDWHWSWRLASHGFALFECAAIRRKTMELILQDLVQAVRGGKSLELATLLDGTTLDAVERFLVDPAQGSSSALHRHPSLLPLLLLMRDQLGYNEASLGSGSHSLQNSTPARRSIP